MIYYNLRAKYLAWLQQRRCRRGQHEWKLQLEFKGGAMHSLHEQCKHCPARGKTIMDKAAIDATQQPDETLIFCQRLEAFLDTEFAGLNIDSVVSTLVSAVALIYLDKLHPDKGFNEAWHLMQDEIQTAMLMAQHIILNRRPSD